MTFLQFLKQFAHKMNAVVQAIPTSKTNQQTMHSLSFMGCVHVDREITEWLLFLAGFFDAGHEYDTNGVQTSRFTWPCWDHLDCVRFSSVLFEKYNSPRMTCKDK